MLSFRNCIDSDPERPPQIETYTLLTCTTVTPVFPFSSPHPSPTHLMLIGLGVLDQDLRSTSFGSRVDASRVNTNVPCLIGNRHMVFNLLFSPSHCPVGLEFRLGDSHRAVSIVRRLNTVRGIFRLLERMLCHALPLEPMAKYTMVLRSPGP